MGRLAMIFLESPANPTNVLVDVDAVVAARNTLFSDEEEKPPIVIDNTFLGPLWQKQLRPGVDTVVYSLTKYAGGHIDLVEIGRAHVSTPVTIAHLVSRLLLDKYTHFIQLTTHT